MSSNRDLLRFLQENNESWITAKTLAMKLGVSERTVKSKIAQLRKSGSEIASGPKGYRVKGTLNSTPNTTNYLPHNIKQRKSWLIRKLLKTENKVNVYDLSAQLYINDVELRKELKDLTTKRFNWDIK
ncbi:HTH domain-containing protein [Lactobacillus sp. ESL0791]|uniref:HTH domain-containing protein n=1 Tax=Lactobacillus sp. ESL0791 TaxID=2983234 RepID=UPI0023F622A9|nr:HTH domain-containing protein [Lactobacillus sp. ESL0791]MDF7639565.1 HTH domain-containing protein [Lactobacillus sp. ESL0791]